MNTNLVIDHQVFKMSKLADAQLWTAAHLFINLFMV